MSARIVYDHCVYTTQDLTRVSDIERKLGSWLRRLNLIILNVLLKWNLFEFYRDFQTRWNIGSEYTAYHQM